MDLERELRSFWPIMLTVGVVNVAVPFVVYDGLWGAVLFLIVVDVLAMGFCACHGWLRCRRDHLELIEAYRSENRTLRQLAGLETEDEN